MKLKKFENFDEIPTYDPSIKRGSKEYDDDEEYNKAMGNVIDSIMTDIEFSLEQAIEKYPDINVIAELKGYKSQYPGQDQRLWFDYLIDRIEELIKEFDK